ncbi:MAG: cation transporter [Deltaproteobacteria bacterium]|nr:cation transporter [Deltaproteobacteria bacterium]
MPDPRCMRCARKVPWICILGNASLAVYKLLLGVLGGSTALIVDGAHSFTDVIGSTNILIASTISRRPPDDDHPYGHGKAEFIGGGIVYSVLLVLSASMVFGAGRIIVTGEHEAPHYVTLLAAGVSVLVNYFMYLYGNCAGTRCNSPALMADAFENRADAISSLAAVVGIAGGIFVDPICDPIAAAVVGLIIMYNCITQLKDSLSNLIDRSLPPEVGRSVRRVVMTHKGVEAVDYVRTRQTGPQYWVDIGIRVSGDLGIARSDAIAASIRTDLMRRCDQFQHVEVFVAPATAGASAIQKSGMSIAHAQSDAE